LDYCTKDIHNSTEEYEIKFHFYPMFNRKNNSSAKSESGTSFQNSIRTIGELHSEKHSFTQVSPSRKGNFGDYNNIFRIPTGEPGKFPAFRFDLLPGE
jgi:3-deoxy-D-manno-octulosonic acid (KDO) 8-phosphate synthase